MIDLPSLWDQILQRHRLEITLALVAATLIGIGVFWLNSANNDPEIKILSAITESTSSAKTMLYIDISGEVVNPGVYKFEANTRVDDAINAAGGLLESADSNWIETNLNRAEKIRDGMKVHIPAKNEAKNEDHAVNTITATNKINLNLATNAEIESLPGIGPVTAKKLIDNRPYVEVDELLDKKVVGQKVFEQIKDLVVAW